MVPLDLAIFYAASLLLVPLAERAPGSWGQTLNRLFGRVATSVWGACVLSGVTILTLLPMEKPGVETSTLLVPPLRVLAAYGVFYAFGWLLFRRRDLIEPVGAKWRTPMAAGVFVSALYLVVTVGVPITDPATFHFVAVVLAGLATWLLVFGILGSFISLMGGPRPAVRYLSDAAYWMYLVHLPPTIWITGLLAPMDLPAVIKFAIVLTGTTAVTLLSYDVLVRSTAVGELLNGRRYHPKVGSGYISMSATQ